jgi:hypothetical protein
VDNNHLAKTHRRAHERLRDLSHQRDCLASPPAVVAREDVDGGKDRLVVWYSARKIRPAARASTAR